MSAPVLIKKHRLEEYRLRDAEGARTQSLLSLLPSNMDSVLDIGARDGHFSRLLTSHFRSVTALDLVKPTFQIPGVTPVAGDVTNLRYPNSSFDVVFCAEVLEHIPALEQACKELARVARHQVIVGVPYRQDTRVGRTTCQSCGKKNPPWGHINTFDRERLKSLFPSMDVEFHYAWHTDEETNWLSVWLMDLAGNPYGSYTQDEPCTHCGECIGLPPKKRPAWKRAASRLSLLIQNLQKPYIRPRANWIHAVFTPRVVWNHEVSH